MSQLEEYIVPAIIFVPASAIITFIIPSFWDWFEATTGIESIGHFGPAIWCFIAVYALLMFLFVTYQIFFRKDLAKD